MAYKMEKQFRIVILGTLKDDGTLDKTKSKYEASGNVINKSSTVPVQTESASVEDKGGYPPGADSVDKFVNNCIKNLKAQGGIP